MQEPLCSSAPGGERLDPFDGDDMIFRLVSRYEECRDVVALLTEIGGTLGAQHEQGSRKRVYLLPSSQKDFWSFPEVESDRSRNGTVESARAGSSGLGTVMAQPSVSGGAPIA